MSQGSSPTSAERAQRPNGGVNWTGAGVTAGMIVDRQGHAPEALVAHLMEATPDADLRAVRELLAEARPSTCRETVALIVDALDARAELGR